jgi:hypothetical protein
MEKDDSVEEEITRSKFDNLPNYFLNLTPSKGKFRPFDLSLTFHKEKSIPFTLSSPKSSVFDRLISDVNRRTTTNLKIQNYRLTLEQEYEKSFLSPARLSKENEKNLLERLELDNERRKENSLKLEKFKEDQKSPKISSKPWPSQKTEEVISRLFTDKRSEYQKREETRCKNIEQENKELKKILQLRHPTRRLDHERINKIAQTSPKCKHFSIQLSPSQLNKSKSHSSLKFQKP